LRCETRLSIAEGESWEQRDAAETPLPSFARESAGMPQEKRLCSRAATVQHPHANTPIGNRARKLGYVACETCLRHAIPTIDSIHGQPIYPTNRRDTADNRSGSKTANQPGHHRDRINIVQSGRAATVCNPRASTSITTVQSETKHSSLKRHMIRRQSIRSKTAKLIYLTLR
jgi:hypothetical protein